MNIFLKTAKILKNPRQGAIIGLFILLLAVILIFFWAYYSVKIPASTGLKPSSQVLEVIDKSDPRYYYEQYQVYSYNGIIKEVGENHIFFEATHFKDRAIVQSLFKASFGPETLFVKKDLYKLHQLDPENYEAAFEPASQKNLKVGGQIQIFSDEDIKYALEFPASKVEIVYQSQEF